MWVSVYEDLLKVRKFKLFTLKLKCSKSEGIGILVQLWMWGLYNADRTGYIKSCTDEELQEIFVGGSIVNPKKIVAALFEFDWIDRRDDCVYLHDWEDWQESWYKYLDKKEYDKKRKQDAKKKSAAKPEENCINTEPVQCTDLEAPDKQPVLEESEQLSMLPDKAVKKAKNNYPEKFNEFWDIYPRHVEKSRAFQCFKARVSDGFSPDQLILAAKRYAEQCRKRHTEEQYIKHGATFLSTNLAFEDFLPKEEPKVSGDENPFADYTMEFL